MQGLQVTETSGYVFNCTMEILPQNDEQQINGVLFNNETKTTSNNSTL